jgi:hypothetical protein
MKADVHFAKGERFEQAQSRLIPEFDWELLIEGCYQASFQFILAGTEWRGTRHSDNHPHAEALGLLTRSSAPSEVLGAWSGPEKSRSGRVYGKQTDGVESVAARARMAVIRDWASAARP